MSKRADPPAVDPDPIDYGTLGENFVEHICRLAFVEDFVFRRPKYRRGSHEKELCDVLVLFGDACVLIEVKTADRVAHQGWTVDDEVKWANDQGETARRQLQGAFKALCKGLVPTVANRFQGSIDLKQAGLTKFFAIAAIDHPPLVQYGHHDGFTCASAHLPRRGRSTETLSIWTRTQCSR